MVQKPVRPVPEVSFFFGAAGATPSATSDARDQGYERNEFEPSAKSLSMSRSAADHAKRVGLDRAEVYEVVNFPERVEPDRSNPGRSRYKKGSLTVVVSDDGCVLAVFDSRDGRR